MRYEEIHNYTQNIRDRVNTIKALMPPQTDLDTLMSNYYTLQKDPQNIIARKSFDTLYPHVKVQLTTQKFGEICNQIHHATSALCTLLPPEYALGAQAIGTGVDVFGHINTMYQTPNAMNAMHLTNSVITFVASFLKAEDKTGTYIAEEFRATHQMIMSCMRQIAHLEVTVYNALRQQQDQIKQTIKSQQEVLLKRFEQTIYIQRQLEAKTSQLEEKIATLEHGVTQALHFQFEHLQRNYQDIRHILSDLQEHSIKTLIIESKRAMDSDAIEVDAENEFTHFHQLIDTFHQKLMALRGNPNMIGDTTSDPVNIITALTPELGKTNPVYRQLGLLASNLQQEEHTFNIHALHHPLLWFEAVDIIHQLVETYIKHLAERTSTVEEPPQFIFHFPGNANQKAITLRKLEDIQIMANSLLEVDELVTRSIPHIGQKIISNIVDLNTELLKLETAFQKEPEQHYVNRIKSHIPEYTQKIQSSIPPDNQIQSLVWKIHSAFKDSAALLTKEQGRWGYGYCIQQGLTKTPRGKIYHDTTPVFSSVVYERGIRSEIKGAIEECITHMPRTLDSAFSSFHFSLFHAVNTPPFPIIYINKNFILWNKWSRWFELPRPLATMEFFENNITFHLEYKNDEAEFSFQDNNGQKLITYTGKHHMMHHGMKELSMFYFMYHINGFPQKHESHFPGIQPESEQEDFNSKARRLKDESETFYISHRVNSIPTLQDVKKQWKEDKSIYEKLLPDIEKRNKENYKALYIAYHKRLYASFHNMGTPFSQSIYRIVSSYTLFTSCMFLLYRGTQASIDLLDDKILFKSLENIEAFFRNYNGEGVHCHIQFTVVKDMILSQFYQHAEYYNFLLGQASKTLPTSHFQHDIQKTTNTIIRTMDMIRITEPQRKQEQAVTPTTTLEEAYATHFGCIQEELSKQNVLIQRITDARQISFV